MKGVGLAALVAQMHVMGLLADDTRSIVVARRRDDVSEDFITQYDRERAGIIKKRHLKYTESLDIVFNKVEDLYRFNQAEAKRQRKSEKRRRENEVK